MTELRNSFIILFYTHMPREAAHTKAIMPSFFGFINFEKYCH
jgi:hypothetical protein